MLLSLLCFSIKLNYNCMYLNNYILNIIDIYTAYLALKKEKGIYTFDKHTYHILSSMVYAKNELVVRPMRCSKSKFKCKKNVKYIPTNYLNREAAGVIRHSPGFITGFEEV